MRWDFHNIAAEGYSLLRYVDWLFVTDALEELTASSFMVGKEV